MNAGKSTALLQFAHNYEERGLSVIVLTAAIDNRYGHGRVTSRLGVSRPAEVFTPATDFCERLAEFEKPAGVLIDEAQFLTPAQVRQLHRIVHLKQVPVFCFGLRSDFQGNPFPGSALLLTLADTVEELKSLCGCGSKASMNIRVDAEGNRLLDGPQTEIGGNARYRSVCPRCFYLSEPGRVPLKLAA